MRSSADEWADIVSDDDADVGEEDSDDDDDDDDDDVNEEMYRGYEEEVSGFGCDTAGGTGLTGWSHHGEYRKIG